MRIARIAGLVIRGAAVALIASSTSAPVLAQQSTPDVVAEIKAQAARDDADAMFALAIMHEVGRDAPKNMGGVGPPARARCA